MKPKSLINSKIGKENRKVQGINKEKLNKSKKKNNCLSLNLCFSKIIKICNVPMRRKYI